MIFKGILGEDIFLMLWFCWILMVVAMMVLVDIQYQECVQYLVEVVV